MCNSKNSNDILLRLSIDIWIDQMENTRDLSSNNYIISDQSRFCVTVAILSAVLGFAVLASLAFRSEAPSVAHQTRNSLHQVSVVSGLLMNQIIITCSIILHSHL